MQKVTRWVVGVVCLVLLPTLASAQVTITGVVKDASGAVLPGVTVETSSVVLIEKTRTAVTDGTSLYRIEGLRPPMATVGCSLAIGHSGHGPV